MTVPARTLGALRLEVGESLIARTVQLPIQQFIHTQGVSSAFLLAAAVIALIWANSPWSTSYYHIWHVELRLSGLRLPIHAWINDFMMALFFFLVGMEIKQEIVHGELADLRRAALPIFGGIGGMIVPALIFVLLNHGRPGAYGWGVPMATDIAFSLGVLAMVKGIPAELKVFLLSLAIADDIGAIVVIALFYTDTLHLEQLIIAALLLALIFLCRRVGVDRLIIYAVLGLAFWLAILRSGIHATIAGVILGMIMPVHARIPLDTFGEVCAETLAEFRKAFAAGDNAMANRRLGAMEYLISRTESPADQITRKLHDWIAFLVLPLFALSNAGVTFSLSTWRSLLHSPLAWGVLVGLLAGKPLGIFATCWIAVKVKVAQLPQSVRWSHVVGVGVLAGIGFTVSLFISALAFQDPAMLDAAKTAVLSASLLAGVSGYVLLSSIAKRDSADAD
ncbi:Na+/H+ antiporter NhaA [Alloacidobacterium sp.]|uniref:Na+/H+ antiporter NhaA n=1 Tax=Alloacidobacterium sp. TaxID=2951999 RepID=UPI002D3C70AA|nr:Na+/H+ antiporter NhaA [Alloacidobacterium sp.]HYK36709.1 Na+/H+ antiporter NhaA [Alloacidobacterium sp.]